MRGNKVMVKVTLNSKKIFLWLSSIILGAIITLMVYHQTAETATTPFKNIDIVVVQNTENRFLASSPHIFTSYNDRCDPTKQVCLATEEDIDTLARTIWAEARGDGYDGMRAVAEVIINRALDPKRWPSSITKVAKQRRQFSCWNKWDPNLRKLLKVTESDAAFRLAKEVARDVVEGKSPLRGNLTHFHTHHVAPKWAQGQTPHLKVGGHLFYTL